jgi:hypothetical protein
MRLMIRVSSPTRLSLSRLERLAYSSSSVGIATIPQWPRSLRSQPRKTRISIAVSNRSVFARRARATPRRWPPRTLEQCARCVTIVGQPEPELGLWVMITESWY